MTPTLDSGAPLNLDQHCSAGKWKKGTRTIPVRKLMFGSTGTQNGKPKGACAPATARASYCKLDTQQLAHSASDIWQPCQFSECGDRNCQRGLRTRYGQSVIVQAVVDEHNTLLVPHVLPVQVTALRLHIVRRNLPAEIPATVEQGARSGSHSNTNASTGQPNEDFYRTSQNMAEELTPYMTRMSHDVSAVNRHPLPQLCCLSNYRLRFTALDLS